MLHVAEIMLVRLQDVLRNPVLFPRRSFTMCVAAGMDHVTDGPKGPNIAVTYAARTFMRGALVRMGAVPLK